MNELVKVFQYEGSNVRTVVRDGELWWVAADVCRGIGLSAHKGSYSHHLDKLDIEDKLLINRDVILKATPMPKVGVIREGLERLGAIMVDADDPLITANASGWIVNESGLYTLILRSDKEEAKKFKKWVTSEVLPSIRKTGKYEIAPQPKLPQNFAEALRMLADSVEVVEAQKKAIAEAQPKVEAFDHFIDGVNCKSVARVAQEIGTGQNTLYAFLRGIDYLLSGGERHNNPYQTYVDRGFFTVKTSPVKMGEKFVNVSQTLITPKGEAHIAELWRNRFKEAA